MDTGDHITRPMRLCGARGYGSAIVEAMFALVGQPYEFVDLDGFDRPGAARERLRVLNPLCQVPTLQLACGTILTETAAIALHLSDHAPGLAPAIGTPDRPKFHRLLIWLVANLYPTFTYGDYPARWAPSAPAELKTATDQCRERLYVWLETQVVGPFVLGDTISALDLYLAILTRWHPRPDWFDANTPRIARAARRTRSLPPIARIMTLNGW